MTKNSLSPPSNNKPIKVAPTDGVKKLMQDIRPDADPETVLDNFAKLAAQHNQGDNPKDTDPKLSRAFGMVMSTMSLDNHARLADTTNDKLAPLAITVAQQLISDYGCTTAAEKTLAEVVANAYIRILRYSEALNTVYDQGTTTREINKYMTATSLELDRANRQYLTALGVLKSFRQPSVNVTFKATNAFVAQNQSVNAAPNQNPEVKTNEAQ
jgi:hypothetical protein